MRAPRGVRVAAIFFAVAVASSLGGRPGSVEDGAEPCTGTPTENGDGTTTIACLDGTKDLVCTNSDCTGVTAVLGIDPTITRVALDTVTDLNQLDLAESDRLQSVRLPSLRLVRSLSIRDNPALATVSLPALAAPPGPSYGGAIFNNKALRTLVLPRLISAEAGLYIAGNSVLSELGLPALTMAGSLEVAGNAAYPQCRAEAVLSHLTSPPAHGSTISGNDTTATCPP
jgi:hypothetical protein